MAASVHAAASAADCPAAGDGRDLRGGVGLPRELAALGVDVGEEPCELGRFRIARDDQPEGERRPGPRIRHAGDALGQRPRRLERRAIVQQRQRLQRRVGAHAPRRAVLAAGRVERHLHRIRRRPAQERVEAAAVAILALALDPPILVVGHVPDAVGLGREDAGAVHLRAEQPARGELAVADHLGFEAEARSAREQPVVGIALGERRRHRGRLSIGRRGDDRPQQRLLAPAAIHQLDGEPVEELGVRGRLALRPEVLAGLDQAASEELLPQAVDVHPRHQRVVAIDEPAGQAEAIGRQRVLHRRQRQGRPRVHALAARGERTALAQLVGGPLEAGPILHHQRAWELQIDERLARLLQGVAGRLQRRRGLAEMRGEVLGAVSGPVSAVAHDDRPERGGNRRADQRIGRRRRRQPEAADPLTDRAVLLRDAQRHARAAREAERTRRFQYRMAWQARRLT